MEDDVLAIGDLARLTGLTVKAVRYYSDVGLVPTAGRDSAGRRRYGAKALARLRLVRTLRALGVGLTTIRAVVEREAEVADVAQREAEELAARIDELKLRRAVLLAVARRGAGAEEVELMHELATLNGNERRRLVGEFLDAVFGDVRRHPAIAGIERSLTPELPDEPTPEQVDAWVELAELSRDQEFRALLHRLAEDHHTLGKDVIHRVVELKSSGQDGVAAVRAIDPTAEDISRIRAAVDPRRDDYLRLLARVNGWAAPEPLTPALEWFLEAVGRHSPNLLAR
ncbi:MerR family transcriptional regulator [Amycolatopsis sp. FDAARGOS 1241]|uniref:helix-turn-helix domain-containing protein n=1 Tax=Amycolatopsis sp. FDAARGOS 1241 TaxID=2778070 RepID=UPI00194E5683|nr:MerR family transcriptional regulator [Amycolatopsis sp. FDAARGOS 1241]QRP45957.1 MerR family transcriptional regulator [Amycolatopsis sp. FDAARGOS 1241]